MDTFESLHERVRSLETRIRFQDAAILLLMLMGVVLVTVGFVAPPKEVEARRFIVKDAAGRERIFLGMNQTESAANLSFNDKDGRSAFFLTILDNGGSGATLSDGRGKDRLGFGVSEQGEVHFQIFDRNGRLVFSAVPSR